MPTLKRSGSVARRIREEMRREPLGVERLQVVEPFTHAEEPYGDVELPAERRHGATAGAAVELGDHDARRAHGLREELALLHRVLSHGAVEDEQRLVRRARHAPAGDANHLAELVHETV